MESKFSFFQAPFMAFFSGDLYRDVAENWKGCGALYIFLLSSAAWVISCAATLAIPMMTVMSNPEMKELLSQLPQCQIEEGKLKIDKPAGYEIKEPKSGIALIRFAIDRKTDEMQPDDPPFVITETAMMIKDASGSYQKTRDREVDSSEIKTYKLSDLNKLMGGKVDFDATSAQRTLEQVLLFVPVGILFVVWPFVFLGHLFQLLIFGGIGMLIANGMQKEMSFEKTMRLSAIAITPAVMVTLFLSVLTLATPVARMVLGLWPMVSVAVSIAYLIMVIRAVPNQEVQQPSTPA